MKITIHIFTLYLFILSLIPCGDGGGGMMGLVNYFLDAEQSIDSGHDQHSDDCEDDLCSLFCICSCCSFALDAPEKIPFLVKSEPPIPLKAPSFLPKFIHSTFRSSIWQPPKFS